jgi:Rrf2 family protein
MQITRQADYALRAVLYLSKIEPDKKASTALIAKSQKIPPSFLAKIISQLSIAGIIHTSRGAHGGVSLARPPSEVTMLDVVEAIDGPIKLNDCTDNAAECPFGEDCPLQEVWCSTQEELVAKLRTTNFAQFNNNGRH